MGTLYTITTSAALVPRAAFLILVACAGPTPAPATSPSTPAPRPITVDILDAGGLDPNGIRGALVAHAVDLRACVHERTNVRVEASVTPTGAMPDPAVIASPPLDTCLAAVIQNIVLPPSGTGAQVTVVIDFP